MLLINARQVVRNGHAYGYYKMDEGPAAASTASLAFMASFKSDGSRFDIQRDELTDLDWLP